MSRSLLRSLLLFFCLILPLVGSAQTFQSAAVQTVSGNPSVTATADFNQDGLPDLVYQDGYTGGSLHVMDGLGDGTFRDVQQIALPAAVGAHITAADVTGDGFPDLIIGYNGFVSNFTPPEYTVLINKGDGTFGAPIFTTFPTLGEPETSVNDVAVADFDGDGFTDFIFAASAGAQLMKGDGTGHFTPQVLFHPPNDDFLNVLIGDFNQDGKPDIAINGYFGIYYALNKGGGSFTGPQTLTNILMNPPAGFSVADVNLDGHADILFGSNEGSLFIAYGNGDGTFQPPAHRGASPPAIFLVKDVTGDGLPDIVTFNGAGPVVDVQDTSGSFSNPELSGPAVGDRGLLAPVFADFDGDGIDDIVSVATGALVFSRGKSDGTFNGAQATVVGDDAVDLHPADFNNDGKEDVVVTVEDGSYYGGLLVFTGDGTGGFNQSGETNRNDTYAGQSSIADFNHDGIPDVFNAGYVLTGDGHGGFASSQLVAPIPQGSYPEGFSAVADFNEDGYPDPVATTAPTSYPGNTTLSVAISTGANAWAATQVSLPADPGPLVAADFNHDGHQDLATASTTGIFILTGDGKGNFTLSQTLPLNYTAGDYGAIHSGWYDMEAADLDGDGNIDLIVPIADKNVLQIYYGRSDGTFDPVVSLPTAQDVRFATVYDINSDGIPDLLLSGHALVRILHGLGHRTFEATPTSYAANPYPQKVRVADVNGDGNPDLLVGNGGYSGILEPGLTFTVLLNGAPPVSPDALSGAITCTPEPSLASQSFSCTVTFTPLDNSATPTGTVTFLLDGVTAGTVGLNDQKATVTFASGAALGQHRIEADFPGDSNFRATKAVTNHTVVKASASLLLSGPARVAFGQTLPLTATASGTMGVPTGTVTFNEGAAILGQAALSTGVASFSTAPLTSGSHILVATYGGDNTYASETSNTITVVVDAQPTRIVLAVNPTSAPIGTGIALQATVSSSSGTVNGTVLFFDGATQIGSAAVNASGTAQVQTSTLSLGVHSITAQFSASTAFAGSVSAPVQVTITGVPTTTVLTTAPNPSYPNQTVTLAASVSATLPQTVSGAMRFFDGSTSLGDVPVSTSGTASLTTSTLSIGTHTISGQYLGNSVLIPSQSNAIQQVVLDSTFTITAPPTISVQTQHHLTFNITVTPLGQFADDVALACSEFPQYTTCNLSPQSVHLSPSSGPQTLSVYLDTSAVIGYAAAQPPSTPGHPTERFLAGTSFSFLLLLGVRSKRNRTLRRLSASVGIMAILVSMSFFAGCSGKYPASVVPGTYTLQFTGVSANPPMSQSADTQFIVTP